MLGRRREHGGERAGAGSGDAAFRQLATEILEDLYKRHPTQATDLGIHKYDDQLDDLLGGRGEGRVRRGAAGVPVAAGGHRPGDAVARASSSIASSCCTRRRARARDRRRSSRGRRIPTLYSSGITNAAYVMIKRNFAPPAERLKALIAREKPMPAALAEARKNLDNPPQIYTRDRDRADRRQRQLLQERRARRRSRT